MAEPAPSALALARLRALGGASAETSTAVSAAARAAGREIVLAPGAAGQVALLTWPADIDLAEQADHSLWATPSTALQLTFAACVRLCWEDPHLHPYPGRVVAPERVFALLARVNARPDEAIPIFDNAPKRSLAWLRRAAWIDQDDEGVRFGVRLAALPDDDVAALRRVYEAMPGPQDEEAATPGDGAVPGREDEEAATPGDGAVPGREDEEAATPGDGAVPGREDEQAATPQDEVVPGREDEQAAAPEDGETADE
ncbi:hypothetical protein GCM10023196_021020 [Actinoallomurus vinaceus]|uniref:Uncharacterized protein n=1 Tax=Actinoallomurus vinaceus TaxID=1080074 RepID=A0ABP8U8E9_9ACTN